MTTAGCLLFLLADSKIWAALIEVEFILKNDFAIFLLIKNSLIFFVINFILINT